MLHGDSLRTLNGNRKSPAQYLTARTLQLLRHRQAGFNIYALTRPFNLLVQRLWRLMLCVALPAQCSEIARFRSGQLFLTTRSCAGPAY